MSGGLLQLVAYGVEDLLITGDPQITLFKTSFKRYTNFTKKQHTFSNSSLQFGQRTTFHLNAGDLVEDIWLEITFPRLNTPNTVYAWKSFPACTLIQWIEVRIDDIVAYKMTGEWIFLHQNLYGKSEKRKGWNQMVGHVSEMINFTSPKEAFTCNLRIPFWNEISSGIPLASLSGQNVYLDIKLQPIQNILFQGEWNASNSSYDITNPNANSFSKIRLNLSMHLDTIYLDDFEKQQFQTKDHSTWYKSISVDEYHSDLTTIETNIVFTNPLVELLWTFESSKTIQPYNYCDTLDTINNSGATVDAYPSFIYGGSSSVCRRAELILNDVVRVSKRGGAYFNKCQPLQHHTGIYPGVQLYSFALSPEVDLPSGHCPSNTLVLKQELDFFNGDLDNTSYTLKIYKITLNRLNFSNGICSTLYS